MWLLILMDIYVLANVFYNVYFVFCRYYPFYYAPFASDFKGLSQFKISFTADKPLRPFDQLMAVLPKERHVNYSLFYNAHSSSQCFNWNLSLFFFRSSCALPKCYRELIENEESLIQKFYPSGIFVTLDSSYNLNSEYHIT